MKVNIEGVLIATGQNLKRLIKTKTDEFLSFFQAHLPYRPIALERLLFQQAEMLCDEEAEKINHGYLHNSYELERWRG